MPSQTCAYPAPRLAHHESLAGPRAPAQAASLAILLCVQIGCDQQEGVGAVGLPIDDHSTTLVGDGAFGYSIVASADVTGDGVADVVAGSPGGGATDGGAVYVFCGPITTDLSVSSACGTVDGAGTFALGWSVALASDLDGDGQVDLAASDGINYPDSAIYIQSSPLLGAFTTETSTAVLTDNERSDGACTQLASLADADGDGFDQLVVAQARNYATGSIVYVLDGPLSGEIPLEDVTDRIVPSRHVSLGWALTNVGDADGDGLDDLLAGVDLDSTWTTIGGGAWLFEGPIEGELSDADAALTVRSDNGGVQLGWSVSAADDVDGDGRADLWVAIRGEDELPGGAYLYLGGTQGLVKLFDAVAVVRGEEPDDGSLSSIAGLGDVNGDGHPDLGIGYGGDDTAGASAGALWLVSGPESGTLLLGEVGTWFIGAEAGDQLGYNVARGADLDEDGLLNPVVQAYGYDHHQGAVYVLNGLGG